MNKKIVISRYTFFLLALCVLLSLEGIMAIRSVTQAQENLSEKSSTTFTLNPENYGFWENVRSPEQFKEWRQAIVSFYRQVIGIKEPYEPLPLETVYTESIPIGESIVRHRIEYKTTDKLRIPAYLFIPETDIPVPAVIVYHGHGEGKINAAEREGTNETALAKYIAETLGYVVLAPDARSFGEFQIPRKTNHVDYFYSLIFSKKLYMSKLIEDGYQDMALLLSIPQVDMNRIGAAGISMGSWRTLNHTVLHNEIDAAVISGLYIPWDYLFSGEHCRCQHIPKLAAKIKMEDFAATIFPRNIMIQWGEEDKYYKEHDAERLIDRTAKIAEYLGSKEHFTVDKHPAMGHRFSNPEIALFLHKNLGDGAWSPKITN